MANVRDSDTSLWLHNKLGSNEPWTSGSISSQLNAEVLRNIKECFVDLQTQVKLKLLLSFFHIPKRSIDEWRIELEEILEVAQADSEQWVSMLAEILKSFPTTNCLHIDINEPEENRRIFYDLAEEVTKDMKRNNLNLLPIECHYLNKTALNSVVGPQKPIPKLFNLKGKPKSTLLRKEVMERASDMVKHSIKKIPAPTIPLRTRGMPRKMTDTTPLKGIPSLPSSANRLIGGPTVINSPRNRTGPPEKKGGIKVLDITEMPLGYQQAKRRKKMESEEKKQSNAVDEPANSSETPDYAAGLYVPARPPTPPPPPLIPPPTPASFQPPPTPQGIITSHIKEPLTPMTPMPFSRQSSIPIPEGPPPTPTPRIIPKQEYLPEPSNTIQVNQDKLPLSLAQQNIAREPRKQQLVRPPAQLPGVPVQTLTKTVILQVPNHQPQPFVTLSKELMDKAQEIFKSANKATRPEKEHILKFMAGTRENPCPELGNIVTIKLSERAENAQQSDGKIVHLLVETHFQMNYNTGEWKVITKPPKIIP